MSSIDLDQGEIMSSSDRFLHEGLKGNQLLAPAVLLSVPIFSFSVFHPLDNLLSFFPLFSVSLMFPLR